MESRFQSGSLTDTKLTLPNIRDRLDHLEMTYTSINEELSLNLKNFDEIVSEDKDSYDKLARNLLDIETIFVNDLNKFEEGVDKSVMYNEALYARLEKDVNYLRDDQEGLRKKIFQMERRINDMEVQIGESYKG